MDLAGKGGRRQHREREDRQDPRDDRDDHREVGDRDGGVVAEDDRLR